MRSLALERSCQAPDGYGSYALVTVVLRRSR